ncbi:MULTISPECIES: ferritin-like domain-containing protein [unclassified Nitratiruptor]|uniref:ferritin-like domain-containing protein n=1 Tax=unclassified Nitratiruptor TaxID=2624044 RepID=UPI00191671A3|nr:MULTISPECIES: ferritin-like domain-containing protein [unclassified Nitratiruptor]BCD60239.1 hypothetical protein NitYY0810_C1004 [Nitratiruptor sp. YY08-10]BCD64272.1 hypothetical protein NitYY0814_C1117 [Nitratiruptor sp. YY08-14]
MEFFQTLEAIIQISDPYEKMEQFKRFYTLFQNGSIPMNHEQKSIMFHEPSFRGFCEIVDPQKVPRRSRFGTAEGRAILLHAIAHIEYSAIDLALDAAYRFKNLPKQFYKDWLQVADDECRHFLMIDSLLKELGYRYGDFPVHQGLFDAGKASQTLIDRMAVVPRYLEANGLDANPRIIQKLKKFHDPFAIKMTQALDIILTEEIAHVKKGDFWFRWACEQAGCEDIEKEYFQRIEKIYPGTLHSKTEVNIEARKKAGFSCREIELLSKERIDCG